MSSEKVDKKVREAYLVLCMSGKVNVELLACELNLARKDVAEIIVSMAELGLIGLPPEKRLGLENGY